MMTSDFIVDVTEADFEYEVIAYSQNTPVVVDFWAPWCTPCKPLGALLERLAREAAGAFRLARVNVDEAPNLALRYGVRSIPAVKAFSGGEVVAEFTGNLPEGRVREFLEHIQPPSPIALSIEKADSLLAEQQWQAAEAELRHALTLAPDEPEGLLGLSRALLAQGKSHEALSLLTAFPASKQFSRAETLLTFANELEKLRSQPAGVEWPEQEAAFWNAVRLASRGRIAPALDGLLDVLRQDKRNSRVRENILSLLELLGDQNPLTRDYRNELAAVLF